MNEYEFVLPWPPTVNTYWRRRGSQYYISDKGQKYRKDVQQIIRQLRLDIFTKSRLRITIIAEPPDSRRTGEHMNATIQTIPELLIQARGNMTEVSRKLNCNRATVRKYVGDKEGKRHAVVNGVLMVHRGWDKGKATDA